MAYRYNEWRHSLRVEFNERLKAWECALFSAYSGRKLKVYYRGPLDVCQVRAQVIRNPIK